MRGKLNANLIQGRKVFSYPVFCLTGDVILTSRSRLATYSKFIFVMKNIIIQISVDERLCIDCKDVAHIVFVRGHFRMVNGKKYYIKAHYRKK